MKKIYIYSIFFLFLFIYLLIFYLDSKSIPVFSTPPSILFCDLHLAPGELRTCNNSFLFVTILIMLENVKD
jgi:hypothetical protein